MPTPRRILQKNLEGPPISPLSGGMSRTSRGAVSGAPEGTERAHRRTAVLVTVLVHVLLVLLVMPPPPPIATSMPQGGSGGSRMQVTLVDETLSSPPPEPEPAMRKPVSRKKPKTSHAITRPLSTPVAEATLPMPREETDTSDTPAVAPTSEAEPPAAPRETVQRPAHVRGQPPGMPAPDDNARASAALAAKLGSNQGQSNTAAPVGPNMEMDGFHVYYDLFNENRLRAWRDQGMTELFLPLPGTL
ncbi:MAG: hypothetical protein ABIQ70_08570, partial [Dokdonella sp.]